MYYVIGVGGKTTTCIFHQRDECFYLFVFPSIKHFPTNKQDGFVNGHLLSIVLKWQLAANIFLNQFFYVYQRDQKTELGCVSLPWPHPWGNMIGEEMQSISCIMHFISQ